MAFEKVTGGATFNLNQLEVGQEKIAFLKDVVLVDGKYGMQPQLVMVDSAGKELQVIPAGKARYTANAMAMHKNLLPRDKNYNAEDAGKLMSMMGHLVKITCTGAAPSKSPNAKPGDVTKSFQFDCDFEQKLAQ